MKANYPASRFSRLVPLGSATRIPATVALTLALSTTPQFAWAEESAEAVLEEITVTARKRDESLRTVPVTITAFSEDDIVSRGLVTLEDVSAFSPGLSFARQGDQRGGRSESVVRFRGMSINDVSPVRQLASVFVDGIYVSGGLAAISLDDVARVEVIKGPQSAYFGRSTFGGAVNFITRQPDLAEFRADLRLRAAEDNEYDASANADIPLSSGKWALRLGARYYTTDGRYRSAADGGRLGAEETKSVSATLFGQPTENLSLRLRGFYSEDNDGLPPTFALGTNLQNCGPFFAGGKRYFCGELPKVGQVALNTRLEGRATDAFINNAFNSASVARAPFPLDRLGLRRESSRINLSGDWSGGDAHVVSFNAGYNTIKQIRMNDADHTGAQVWAEGHFQDISDSAFELRYTRNGDRLTWQVGASYFDLQYAAPTGATVGWLYPNPLIPNGFFFDQTVSESGVETQGVFGSISYKFTDTISGSLEARYQSEKIDEVAPRVALSETFTNFLPRLILQWTPNADTNVYGIVARGNMPGNFNGNVLQFNETQRQQILEQTGATESVDEAVLDNFELGVKQGFFNGRGFVTAAAYYMTWENQQNRTNAVITDLTTPAGIRTVPVTLGSAVTDLWGVELEGQLRVNSDLLLRGSFNWAASEIQRFACDLCVRVLGRADVSGNSLSRYPEYSGSLGASYTRPLTEGRDWFVHADGIYTGSAWAEVINLAKTSNRWVANLRGGVEGERWRAELFVKNILDDGNYQSAARAGDFTIGNFDITNYVMNVTPAEPRQIGINVHLTF